MLQLYKAGGGSSDIDLVDPVHGDLADRVLQRARGFLHRQGLIEAADLLTNAGFKLWNGTNGFGDPFYVLHADASTEMYTKLYDMKDDPVAQARIVQIASALSHADFSVRFIAATMNDSGPATVPAPRPVTTSVVLDRALAEVERSLAEGRPEVGVDRIHTAFHAYLREKAESAGLNPSADADVEALFGLLRGSHPRLQPTGPRPTDITDVLRGMARVVGALNPLRNRASLAHPPEGDLLPDAEAMLVINAVRTLMHYLETRLSQV